MILPPAGAVHVWSIDLDAPRTDLASVRPDELARAARFHRAHDTRRFLHGRVAMRRILASYTGTAPDALVFAAGEHDKPQLAMPDAPSFNLSHSEGIALLAVAATGDLGVDVECHAERTGLLDLAAAVHGEEEAATLRALAMPERLSRFYTAWVRKEAVLKACGRGLLEDPRTLDVGFDALERWVLVPGVGRRFAVRSLAVPNGVSAAVASSLPMSTVETINEAERAPLLAA